MTTSVPHQALYRRWRAQTFSQIVGQEAVVETLRNAVRAGRVSHAVLFVGPRGTGKTSLARILAKALNCTDLRDGDPCDLCEACTSIREGRAFDLVEIDAASNRGIDAVRELRERIHYPPSDLQRKVYILDEAHQITKDAWNALLKSLEEPPPFVVFMFASTEPSGFPPAILSRLQRYDVRRLTVAEIEGKLQRIIEADGREAEPAAISLIARLAAGGMRDAESMLDQLLAAGAGRIEAAQVRDLLGLADADTVDGFVDALIGGDAGAGLRILDTLDDRGRDMRAFLDQVIESLRRRLLDGLDDPTAAPTVGAVAAAARRLAAIVPDRAGIGGMRLQLELALFDADGPQAPTRPAATELPSVRRAPAPEPQAAPTPEQTAEPTEPATAPEPAADAPAAGPRRPSSTPAAAEPVPPAPATSDRPPTGDALADLLAMWPSIVARVSQHPPTKPLIVACRPVAVDGAIVTLGFPEEQAFLKDVAERKRTLIEQGISETLGRPVGVRCVVANVELVAPDATDGGATLLDEARRIFADDLVDVGEVH